MQETQQENPIDFWKGEFGDAYHQRSPGDVKAAVAFFKRVFSATTADLTDVVEKEPSSIIEFGCGTGTNLQALRRIFPYCATFGTEINERAVEFARATGTGGISRRPIQEFHEMLLAEPINEKATWEMTLTKGLLIHIPPDELPLAYRTLYERTHRWILIAEYYNPTPVEVEYRGHAGKLWKRDFAGEMLATYPDLKLAAYGFAYHGDPVLQQDDLTWFLLEKKK